MFGFNDNPNGTIWKNRNINYNKLLRFPVNPMYDPPNFFPKYYGREIPVFGQGPRPIIIQTNNDIRRALIGKSYAFALNYLKNVGKRRVRITAIDNLLFNLTLEYRIDRVNLRLNSGRNPPFSIDSSQQEGLGYINKYRNKVYVTRVNFG